MGISGGYLGYILGIYWISGKYLGHLLGISYAYLGDGDILGLSCGYIGNVSGIYWGYPGDILVTIW